MFPCTNITLSIERNMQVLLAFVILPHTFYKLVLLSPFLIFLSETIHFLYQPKTTEGQNLPIPIHFRENNVSHLLKLLFDNSLQDNGHLSDTYNSRNYFIYLSLDYPTLVMITAFYYMKHLSKT